MTIFGNWRLTSEWIESENARIPLDSISYVGSLDLMKRLRFFFLLGAIFFGISTLILLFSGSFSGALFTGLICAFFIYLYNFKSTTFVVISHSGFMIQQTTGKIVKGDAQYEKFMDLLFKYRNNFLGLKPDFSYQPSEQSQPSVHAKSPQNNSTNTEQKNGLKISPNGNWECPICHTENNPPIGACKSCDNYIVVKK